MKAFSRQQNDDDDGGDRLQPLDTFDAPRRPDRMRTRCQTTINAATNIHKKTEQHAMTKSTSLLLLPLLLLLQTPSNVNATITLSTTGRQYHSRPASFGMPLEYGLQYVALLQYVEDDLHLCHGEKESYFYNVGGGAEEEERGDWILGKDGHERKGVESNRSMLQYQSQPEQQSLQHPTNNATTTPSSGEIHITPSNGVPVALLAKRGHCTYETKARIASTVTSPHGTVRFVIVYNDDPEDGNSLITMMPSGGGKAGGHELWKDVGLVFVSYESGVGTFFYCCSSRLEMTLTGPHSHPSLPPCLVLHLSSQTYTNTSHPNHPTSTAKEDPVSSSTEKTAGSPPTLNRPPVLPCSSCSLDVCALFRCFYPPLPWGGMGRMGVML